MNRRFLLALAGAALSGLLAILITQQILIKKTRIEMNQNSQVLVFAKNRIPMNTLITKDMLKIGSTSKNLVPETFYTDAQQLVGKIAVSDIEANIPITAKDIINQDTSRIDYSIPRDKRAVTIRIDEASGVAGFASPGSFVDVIWITTPGNNARPVSKTIVQNLKVLAMGQQTQMKTETQTPQRVSNSVTLEASPAQAEALTLASREGSLHLMLRNHADQDLLQTPGVTANNLLGTEAVKEQNVAPRPQIPPVRMALPEVKPRTDIVAAPTPTPGVKMAAITMYEGNSTPRVVMVKP